MKYENSRKIADVVAEFIREQGLSEGLERIRIYEAWDAVVGERGARCTTAKFYKDRVLYCTINSSMIRNQLYFRKEEIIRAINHITGSGSVSLIVLK